MESVQTFGSHTADASSPRPSPPGEERERNAPPAGDLAAVGRAQAAVERKGKLLRQAVESMGAVAFGEAELLGLFGALKVSPHPMLKLPSLEWVRALMAARPEGWKQELVAALNRRQQRIRLAEEDPLEWGWEFECWQDSDALLKGTYKRKQRDAHAPSSGLRPPSPVPTGEGELPASAILGIYGGNRASKSVYAVKRGVQTAKTFARSTLAILSESEAASIKTVQALVWYFLKPHFGQLNGKRDQVFKINYSQANGFTDRKLVLPNGSEIHFLTYNQDPGDYEGWEFGAPVGEYQRVCAELRGAVDASSPRPSSPGEERGKSARFVPPNVGAVADESMPLAWLKMFARRLKFRQAKLLWPFTPVKGITPAIKEMVGVAAVCVESRPAELLPRQNFPDVPKGEMPYIRECVFPGVKAMAIYFFTEFNKFGPAPGRTYYQEVKELLDGKTSEIIERVAYGMARDTVARAFPKFGPWNVVKRWQLPARGTNYFYTDPAGARNWASFWVRVTPGERPDFYIYRDWPDAQTFGEWAVPTEREVNDSNRTGWDGNVGPAQAGLGLGIVKYKQVFLECERVKSGKRESGKAGNEDPYHARLLAKVKGSKEEVYEEIAERYIDPRAGASEHMAEKGGTCIIDEFDEPQYDSTGKLIGPPMEFIPASGVNEDEGLSAVNDLLDWNQEQPLMPILNAPRLFVCEDAMQVRWMFENYTGRGGAKGACKDFADLARYMALGKLSHVDELLSRGKAGRGF